MNTQYNATKRRGVCPHCGEETREGNPYSTEPLPHPHIETCVQILREKLEHVISRLDDHRL